VDNLLSEDPNAGKIAVDVKFESLDDFSPDQIARQVDPLRKLLDLRQQLADIRGSLQGNDKLEEILQATLGDTEKLQRLKAEMEFEGGANGQD
jgi:type VI secretion system protein ImpB